MKRKIYIAAVAVLVLISMIIILTTSHKIEEKKSVTTSINTTTAKVTTATEKETSTTTTKKTTTKKTTTTKPKTTTTTTSAAATTTVEVMDEPVETYETYLEEPIETYEAYSEEPVEEIYYGDYSPYDLQSMGVISWGGYRYTYYSENVLPGYGLQIEGRHTDEYGFVCDEEGYICVASSSLPWGTVVDTPFGRAGKVYDSGCAWDVIDIYTNW